MLKLIPSCMCHGCKAILINIVQYYNHSNNYLSSPAFFFPTASSCAIAYIVISSFILAVHSIEKKLPFITQNQSSLQITMGRLYLR